MLFVYFTSVYFRSMSFSTTIFFFAPSGFSFVSIVITNESSSVCVF